MTHRVRLVAPAGVLVAAVVALIPLDGAISSHVNDTVYQHELLVDGSEVVTWFGSGLALTLMVISVVPWALRHGGVRLTMLLTLSPLTGGLLNRGLKSLTDRPRPAIEHHLTESGGTSFPSGHATGATVTYLVVLIVVVPLLPVAARRPVVVATVVWIGLIGATRVVLGVHHVSDVLAGFMIGTAWVAASAAVFDVPFRWPARAGPHRSAR